MRDGYARAAILALALFLAPAGIALAGDENTTADSSADGVFYALDANQGSGVQVNADDWYDMENALAGDGAQNVYTEGAANTGTGSQDNSEAFQDEWNFIDNANVGDGAQLFRGSNSNGGDRDSDDSVFTAGSYASVGNSDLEAAVSGNSVDVTGSSTGNADAAMKIDGDSRFSGLSGVSAVALGLGSNANQSVSVNVTATMDGI